MVRNIVRYLLREAGLLACPPFYRDGQFYLALLAGLIVFALIYLFVPVKASEITLRQCGVYLTLVIWQPFWEELLFRGIIQGHVHKLPWGQRGVLRISNANITASFAFAFAHLVYNPNPVIVLVFIPSLVFGYFRERHDSIYSAFALHLFYNLGYLVITVIKPDCS